MANEDSAEALRRSACPLIEWTADIDRFVAVVDARLDAVRLDSSAVLPQGLDVLLSKRSPRIDQRLRRALGWIGAVITGRQAFLVLQIAGRHGMLVRRDALPAFDAVIRSGRVSTGARCPGSVQVHPLAALLHLEFPNQLHQRRDYRVKDLAPFLHRGEGRIAHHAAAAEPGPMVHVENG